MKILSLFIILTFVPVYLQATDKTKTLQKSPDENKAKKKSHEKSQFKGPAVTSEMNSWIRNQNCKCDPVDNMMKCARGDVDYIVERIKLWRSQLDERVSDSVNVYISGSTMECAKATEKKISKEFPNWRYMKQKRNPPNIYFKQF